MLRGDGNLKRTEAADQQIKDAQKGDQPNLQANLLKGGYPELGKTPALAKAGDSAIKPAVADTADASKFTPQGILTSLMERFNNPAQRELLHETLSQNKEFYPELFKALTHTDDPGKEAARSGMREIIAKAFNDSAQQA